MSTYEQRELDLPGTMRTPSQQKAAEYKDFGANYVADSSIAVRAPLDSLPGIAKTGDLRTQHETGTSRGTFDPHFRSDFEDRKFWGTRPLYGYMDNNVEQADKRARPRGEHYGSAKFTLDGTQRDNTTVLNGDSLGSQATPVPLRDAERGARVPKSHEHRTDPERTLNHDKNIQDGYVEAQVHGERRKPTRVPLDNVHRLTLNHDAQRLEKKDLIRETGRGPGHEDDFTPDDVTQSLHKLGAQFEAKGVPTYHQKSETRYQPPLPYEPSELESQDFTYGGPIGDGKWERYQRVMPENVTRGTTTYRQGER